MFQILCRMRGPLTGTREAPLVGRGSTRRGFQSRAEAEAVLALLRRRQRRPGARTSFSYGIVERP